MVFLLAVASAFGQTLPTFEAATIKPNKAGDGGSHFSSGKGMVRASGVSLREYVRFALELKDYELVTPDWMNSTRYDVMAKTPTGSSDDDLMPMMHAMLVERFGLKFHKEKRELAVFGLVVARGGPKIQKVSDDDSSRSRGERHKITASPATMPSFAQNLTRRMDRPVVDMTGLKGGFNFTLEWDSDEGTAAPRAMNPDAAPTSDSGRTLFVALQEQLGLKLEPRKAPFDVVVVDHMERVPTEN